MKNSHTPTYLTLCLFLATLIYGCQQQMPAPSSGPAPVGEPKEANTAPEKAEPAAPKTQDGIPVNVPDDTGRVKHWLVFGPFEQNKIEDAQEGEPTRDGFDTDYLGGEAAFAPENADPLQLESGEITPTVETVAPNGRINFNNLYEKDDYAVAYAYCLVESPKDQEVTLGFGSDDSAKVWLNGELVLEEWTERRGTFEDGTKIPVQLKAGTNRLLVKVEDAILGWDFVLNLYTKEAIQAQKEKAELEMAAQFEPMSRDRWNGWKWSHFIPQGDFPEVMWRFPGLVEKHFGEMPMTVRWFDGDLNEVEKAEKPGRYMAVIETKHPENGLPIRRGMTFYALPEKWNWWKESYTTKVGWKPMEGGPFDPKAVEQREEQINRLMTGQLWTSLQTRSEGAALVAYLDELEADGKKPTMADDPYIINNDKFASLKRKLYGLEGEPTPLKAPKQADFLYDGRSGRPLHLLTDKGTLAEAGFTPGLKEELRAICKEWAANPDNGPFSLLVARNGVIVFHEVYNSPGWPEQQLDSKFSVASVTKAVSGLLLARYLDQGLIILDDPVGKYLPDIPTDGDNPLRIRHLVNHTSGLSGHFGYGQGGPTNPFLENLTAHKLLEAEAAPGTAYQYNGNGFNLAGRVMEAVSGKSVQRSFQEDLFQPLGIEGAEIYAMGTSGMFSAEDLAKFGMLLSQKGQYGDKRFFSGIVWSNLLPVPLKDLYPGFKGDNEYGVGLTWMNPKMKPDEKAKDYPYADEKMLGHGSATASILQVGMDSGIVIAGGRASVGTDSENYVNRIVDTVHKHAVPEDQPKEGQ